RVAGGTHDADDVAGRDPLAHRDPRLDLLVAVSGHNVVGVGDLDIPAAAEDRGRAVPIATPPRAARGGRLAADQGDDATRDGPDRRAARGAEIDAVVGGSARC